MDQSQGKSIVLYSDSETILNYALNFLYSYYVGQKPHIMVTDLDMLKQIMVKDFQNFMDHEVI